MESFLSVTNASRLLETLPVPAYLCRADGTILQYNRLAVVLWGREPCTNGNERFCGAVRIYDTQGTPIDHHHSPLAKVLTSGEPARNIELLIERPDASKRAVWWNISPLIDEDGAVLGAINCLYDVTSQKEADRERALVLERERRIRAELEHALAELHRKEKTSRFLAHAGMTLGASLDYHQTLANVTELAVPEICDWCTVDVLNDTGRCERLAVAHVDPDKVALVRELDQLYPDAPYINRGIGDVLRSGRTLWYSEVTDKALDAVARTEEHLQILRKLGLNSLMCVPLIARGRIMGCITLALAESPRRFTELDLVFAEELANQVAMAVDNAKLYREVQTELAEREQAEHEIERLNRNLTERLSELRAVLEVAPIGIAVAQDREGDEIYVNPAAATMLGITPFENASKSGSQGEKLPFRLFKDGRELASGEMPMQYAATNDQQLYDVELDLVRNDGRILNLLNYATPLYDANQAVRGALGILVDVTPLKRAERQIETRARQQAAAARFGQKALEITDLNAVLDEAVDLATKTLDVEFGKISEVTSGGNLMLRAGVGWSTGLVGLTELESGLNSQAGFTLEEKRPVIVEDLRQERRFRAPILEAHKVVSGMSVIIDGPTSQPYGVLGVYTKTRREFSNDDVNFLQTVANVLATAVQRHRMEHSLRESQARLEFILDAAGVGTCDYDIRKGIVQWSPKMAALQVNEKRDFTGRFEAFLENVHPEDRAQVKDAISKAFDGSGTYRVEYRLNRKDKAYWVEGKGRVMYDEHGAPIRMAGICTDISERRRADEAIRVANQALMRRNEEMEQLLYSISHDLKSPLVTTLGFVGLLKEDLASGRFEDVLDSVQRIERAAGRMTDLINDLLQLSRIGRLELDPTLVDVVELVYEIRDELEERLCERAAVLVIDDNLPPVYADRSRLAEVFENLITNALKYACHEPGGHIFIGGGELHDEVHFFVRDAGPGIPAEYHKKVFGLFQRLTTEGEGTGIGLATVNKIVELHDGRVWLESAPDKGATFWLALPKKQYGEVVDGRAVDAFSAG